MTLPNMGFEKMGTSPVYVDTPKCYGVTISAANTARDGSGTLGTLATGGTNGTRLDDIDITAAGTVTAGVVRMFITTASDSTTRLKWEFLVTATTPSTTTASWSQSLRDMGIILGPGDILKFSTHNAETFHITCTRGGDF